VVDVMGRELKIFLTEQVRPKGKTIYALRGSLDDQSLKKKGFIFDPEVAGYYRHLSVANIRNMLRLVIHRHLDSSVSYGPVAQRPNTGLYHPDAPALFTRAEDYLAWYTAREGYRADFPRIGFLFFSSFLTEGQQEPMDEIIRRLETEGFNVIPCFGREQQIVTSLLTDVGGHARVDMLLAFSFKFYNALTPALAAAMQKLGVPIFSAISLYGSTLDDWRKSPVGIEKTAVAWSLAVPEISGLIEPTVLAAKEKIIDIDTGKTYFLNRTVPENLDRLIPRLKNWIRLQRKPNSDKRVALIFYNHHQGKQNIGASYLNVFRSMESILAAMAGDGYTTGKPLSEAEIKELVLASARNIGSWAPGELDKLMESGRVVRLPVAEYAGWFAELPEDFKRDVLNQWGPPEDAKIMRDGDDLIIPAVQMENIVILPEPARGWGDDPMKLMHDTTLFTHHQYLAVYLWIQKSFKADAMIHLGTHSTYEWTPGKQAGLSPSCPPEVLITDVPNIYPYIVDNVGEGIQAKRRGRGVMVSHLTPVLRQSDLSNEYSRMAALINEIERAGSRGSVTVEEKVKELMQLAGTTGVLADIKESDFGQTHGEMHKAEPSGHIHDTAADKVDSGDAFSLIIDGEQDELIHLLGHYLEEVKSTMIPFGMHTFGRSPQPEAVAEMTGAMNRWNPEISREKAADDLARSGPNEIAGLLAGLSGRYVPPGQGNDPLRNPEALPTGRNFYGFNPGKLPSPAAWELGRKAAQEIIDNHIIKHGSYPQKVAVVLWATETLRNEGINESTILTLIGVTPRWSKTGRILGLEVIPGKVLGRPRIDVMVNASGLYRDMFPDKMEYIDRAIRMAGKQTDVENLIARHNSEIKSRLIREGMDPEKADEMSRFRVFSETPGAYGTGVGDMASGSSKWDNPDQVVDVFENRLGYAFGKDRWGVSARDTLKANLSGVDVTVHSRSSNVYGLLDNDDVFQYLGGLSMAVRKESGNAPETLITRQQKKNRLNVEDVGLSIGREMRTRYLNPKWIEGMKSEDYAGAKAMSDFAEYLWGWDMTNPDKVDEAKWQQTYEVYVQDKYGLELKEFFDKASPWAYQSLTGRMLETRRKGYWEADQKTVETLAAEYAKSVITRGVACCDHTCNNPLLNQMVVSILSIPGVLSPELVEQFKLAV
ncbi:MAG: cobaltochelatase subunit CobN, partial [Desulfobacterales bacterium]|nr:cobaltochelatase subunit CobN [Desulfobacterales bacterium]